MVFERGLPLAVLLRDCLRSARAGAGGHPAAAKAVEPFASGHAAKKDAPEHYASTASSERTTRLSNSLGNRLWWCRRGVLCLAHARGVEAACGEALVETPCAVAAEAPYRDPDLTKDTRFVRAHSSLNG